MSEPTRVTVLCFAAVRDAVGAGEVALELPPGGDGARRGAVPALVERFASLSPWAEALRVAVNGAYAAEGDAVRAGDEVAVIPPVSGG
ncbi:MAG: MoaD/ThiS family protein [Polyangiales bacterium]